MHTAIEADTDQICDQPEVTYRAYRAQHGQAVMAGSVLAYKFCSKAQIRDAGAPRIGKMSGGNEMVRVEKRLARSRCMIEKSECAARADCIVIDPLKKRRNGGTRATRAQRMEVPVKRVSLVNAGTVFRVNLIVRTAWRATASRMGQAIACSDPAQSAEPILIEVSDLCWPDGWIAEARSVTSVGRACLVVDRSHLAETARHATPTTPFRPHWRANLKSSFASWVLGDTPRTAHYAKLPHPHRRTVFGVVFMPHVDGLEQPLHWAVWTRDAAGRLDGAGQRRGVQPYGPTGWVICVGGNPRGPGLTTSSAERRRRGVRPICTCVSTRQCSMRSVPRFRGLLRPGCFGRAVRHLAAMGF